MKQHQYKINVAWTGNLGRGTENYTSYGRSHLILAEGKQVIHCSSDPSFRGDNTKYNPEEMFIASLSSCHMLWYLHLCAEAKINVVAYTDIATGIMEEAAGGSGRFKEVTLHPEVVVTNESMIEKANELHHKANQFCFIANSCNFPIHHKPACKVKHD
ncbi:MAG TPA: OsmC family protein [Chitinophagaceae bacterium]|nr:OsmC family protein [Chitinophagaceae bacterium]